MFKTKKAHHRSLYLHPIVSFIMIDMYWYCMSNNRPFVVTDTVSTIEEDKKLGRVSSTHRTGRAIDLSVKGWSKSFINDFCLHFNNKYYQQAALSSSTSQPTLCVYHMGTAKHIHVQVNQQYALNIDLAQIPSKSL